MLAELPQGRLRLHGSRLLRYPTDDVRTPRRQLHTVARPDTAHLGYARSAGPPAQPRGVAACRFAPPRGLPVPHEDSRSHPPQSRDYFLNPHTNLNLSISWRLPGHLRVRSNPPNEFNRTGASSTAQHAPCELLIATPAVQTFRSRVYFRTELQQNSSPLRLKPQAERRLRINWLSDYVPAGTRTRDPMIKSRNV